MDPTGIASRGQATQRLERLGPPHVFEAFGVRFAVRTSEDWLMIGVEEFLPQRWTRVKEASSKGLICYSIRRTPDGFYWLLARQRRVLVQTRALGRALQTLRGALVEHVGRNTTQYTMVHAGVVGWKGRAILLPGDSMSGKSTLVAALVKAGATYYSDEVALLDEDGLVHPYPRPLNLRDSAVIRKRATTQATPAGLGASVGTNPIPVGMVVFSEFSVKQAWQITPLTPGMAVAQGMRYTFSARAAPARVMQAWARTIDGALTWTWKRGDATLAARQLLAALESGSLPR